MLVFDWPTVGHVAKLVFESGRTVLVSLGFAATSCVFSKKGAIPQRKGKVEVPITTEGRVFGNINNHHALQQKISKG